MNIIFWPCHQFKNSNLMEPLSAVPVTEFESSIVLLQQFSQSKYRIAVKCFIDISKDGQRILP